MTQEILLGAILVRDGRMLLARGAGGALELPGGPLREDHDDVDLGMADYLLDFGVRIPDIEEAFLQTSYVPRAGGQIVLNLYAPAEWEGEPDEATSLVAWHAIDELASADMDAGIRHAVLTAFGLAQDDLDERIAAALGGIEASSREIPISDYVHAASQHSALSTQHFAYDWFIASRWRNAEAVDGLAERLRASGARVYSFRDADDVWNAAARMKPAEEYMAEFEARDWRADPFVRQVFDQDMDALRQSAALVLLLPAGTSSHMEAGIAYGMGKRCILVGDAGKAESLYLIFSESYPSADAFLEGVR